MKFYIASSLKNFKNVQFFSKSLIEKGWQQTYDWTKNISGDKKEEDLIKIASLEQKGIKDADIIILLLPAGRGSHVELGIALSMNKKIYLCSEKKEEFAIENTVAFYCLPNVRKIVGTKEEILEEILNEN